MDTIEAHSNRIIDDTIDALRSGQTDPTDQRPRPSMSLRPKPPEVPGVVIIGVPVETPYAELFELDRALQLATRTSQLPLLDALLRSTSRDRGLGGGLSPTAVAERLLDGLAPMLAAELSNDGADGQREPHHQQPLELLIISLRLAQVAQWICEREIGDPSAHELLPRASEAAFLCASLPLRLLDEADRPIDAMAEEIWKPYRRAADDSRISVARCRRDAMRTRTRWLELLFSMERHPTLHAQSPAAIDQRLRRLIRRDPVQLDATGMRLLQRGLHVFQADEPLLLSTQRHAPGSERQQLLDLTAMHLLPRYLTDEAIGLLLGLRDAQLRDDGERRSKLSKLQAATWWCTSRALLPLLALSGLLTLALALAAPLAAAQLLPIPRGVVTGVWVLALIMAVAWAVLLVPVVTIGGREGSYLAMLRMPATSAFGLAILLSFNSVWLEPPSSVWAGTLPAASIALAGFYLAIETINQGAEGASAAKRAGLLTLVGAGASFCVSFLVMNTVAPVLLASNPAFDTTMGSPTGRLWAVLLATSVAFVLGTFLQAIWDEAPVTAPLSRLRLR